MNDYTPAKFRSLSAKFSRFIVALLTWLVAVIMVWDIRHHTFDLTKAVLLCAVVAFVGGLVSRFTIRSLARPLALLEHGITAVSQGKLEPIQVSATRDEIQHLGESFNRMISDLKASQEEIRQNRELLEERIRQRTEDLQKAAEKYEAEMKAGDWIQQFKLSACHNFEHQTPCKTNHYDRK